MGDFRGQRPKGGEAIELANLAIESFETLGRECGRDGGCKPRSGAFSSISRSKPTAFQAVSFEHRFSSVVRLSRSGWEGRVDWTTR